MAKSKYIPKYTYEIVTESEYSKYIIVYVDDKVFFNGKKNNQIFTNKQPDFIIVEDTKQILISYVPSNEISLLNGIRDKNEPKLVPSNTSSGIFTDGIYKRNGIVLDPNNVKDAAIIEEIKIQMRAGEADLAAIKDNISGNVQSAKELAAKAKAAKELATKKAKELADKAKKAKELVAKQKKKLEDLKKAANDKVNFLKDQAKISPSQAKAAILAILLPILTKFINAEKAANAIINRLISKTKKQLKNKGRVTVNGGKIIFTPKDNANYQQFKQDFDRKVKSLKNVIQTLKTILDTLLTILRIMKAALLAAKVYATILRAKMKRLAAKATAEAASASPSKPANAEYLAFKEINDPIIEELEKKIDDYVSIIAAATAILSTFQKLVSRILDKLNTLSFTITQPNTLTSGTVSSDLINILNIPTPQILEYEYTSVNNKEYIIRITTTPSGAKQAVAYEKFSNLKITQSAPSLVRNEDELLEELKRILG